MNDDDFPHAAAARIVEHMNDDHADALLAIVRTQGGVPEATAARMLAITPRTLDIEVTAPTGHRTTIVIDPPIAPLDTVRARLVAMTKAARAALVESAS